ncbi:GrpB family protein [Paramicrobacterium chengjingii]|uniref:GrpB family protein n=1 Tax=Paramicrobacterium chengjingii TaxID=2769067 RepID=A0ABX6YGG2_9MICO|nr:GrpB family protein [Microbacterium chengjingii]QPZ37857.1 GrpB family protein [Microbacterium chengjingii]
MPTLHDITTFFDDTPPHGKSPWVVPPSPRPIDIVEYDETWPMQYAERESQIRRSLGALVLDIFHAGSTSVPGLPAKPVIDIELIVADPSHEALWLTPLVDLGYILTVREPWWFEHRCLTASDRSVNLHVFGPDSPEPWKQRIFRDHLRQNTNDRMLYADAKRAAALAATDRGETMMEYNRRKQSVIRDIYTRAFIAAGLTPG